MKISYVTTYNASDKSKWSGTGYSVAKMLENQNFDVDYIGDLQTNQHLSLTVKKHFYRRFLRKTFDLSREPLIAKGYAEQIQKKLTSNPDIIFSPGSIPIALLETKRPKVFYTDATFAGMLGFYDSFSGLCKETIRHGNYLEQKALESAKLVIYSSDWAAKTAIDNYNVDPAKIHIVPFGANIVCRRNGNDIKNIVGHRNKNTLNLLFVGVDWTRKGGEKAVRITKELNDSGIKTELHIVGIKELPFDNVPSYIINHGYIRKDTEEGVKKLEQLFVNAHFFILPTFADTTPIVFSEANSYGLPCITTKVGGITTVIKDEINGKTFSLETDSFEWCNYISDTFNDKVKYRALCLSSFNEYENKLNWNTTGKTIKNLIKQL